MRPRVAICIPECAPHAPYGCVECGRCPQGALRVPLAGWAFYLARRRDRAFAASDTGAAAHFNAAADAALVALRDAPLLASYLLLEASADAGNPALRPYDSLLLCASVAGLAAGGLSVALRLVRHACPLADRAWECAAPWGAQAAAVTHLAATV